MKNSKKLIIMYGPTGVGKTDTSLLLSTMTHIEIINGDVGQLYQPIAIGTAKPDWQQESVPHHLFDYCTTPKDITVVIYRKLLLDTAEAIWARGATPVIVGGSGFYIKSLFFPPKQSEFVYLEQKKDANLTSTSLDSCSTEELWNLLYQHDPKRAQELIIQDRYRIMRALELVQKGVKPSSVAPEYVPFPADVLVLFLSRPREELYQRINDRTETMMQQGWIDEVKPLLGTTWEPFLLRKKLLGYNDIIDYLKLDNPTPDNYEHLIVTIQQKTRNYAKRQCTFWRMLKKVLDTHFEYPSSAQEVDLTEKSTTLTKVLEAFLKGN